MMPRTAIKTVISTNTRIIRFAIAVLFEPIRTQTIRRPAPDKAERSTPAHVAEVARVRALPETGSAGHRGPGDSCPGHRGSARWKDAPPHAASRPIAVARLAAR